MTHNELRSTASQLVADGKGILAADESGPTIAKRFQSINIESTEDNRRAYRDLFFTTPGAADFVSGVILFDETLRQNGLNGKPFAKTLADLGIIPGIKVDKGVKPLSSFPDEVVTEGLDGLRDRLVEYKNLGAKFAKWRAVITIGDEIPSTACLHTNAHALARYAALCQDVGIVPIVEPEIIMDGTHTIERCFEVTKATLHTVFNELYLQNILLEGMLLKPNMVISGTKCSRQADTNTVAQMTVNVLKECVPSAVAGIVFLSGGQSDEAATAHLNAMNAMNPSLPWKLSFSYGRALQAPALKAWAGQTRNVDLAKKAFFHRAKCNSAASRGRYHAAMEREFSG